MTLAFFWTVFLGVVWFVFSCAIWNDAMRLEGKGYRLRFGSPSLWFFIVLGFSVPAAALYWIAHHSTLADLEKKESDPGNSGTGETGGMEDAQPNREARE